MEQKIIPTTSIQLVLRANSNVKKLFFTILLQKVLWVCYQQILLNLANGPLELTLELLLELSS